MWRSANTCYPHAREWVLKRERERKRTIYDKNKSYFFRSYSMFINRPCVWVTKVSHVGSNWERIYAASAHFIGFKASTSSDFAEINWKFCYWKWRLQLEANWKQNVESRGWEAGIVLFCFMPFHFWFVVIKFDFYLW